MISIAFGGLAAFEDWLWLLTAVSRRLTVRELKQIWDHKNCFEIQSPDDSEDDGQSYFAHKVFSVAGLVRNTISFLMNR